jgi:hypothetical protein
VQTSDKSSLLGQLEALASSVQTHNFSDDQQQKGTDESALGTTGPEGFDQSRDLGDRGPGREFWRAIGSDSDEICQIRCHDSGPLYQIGSNPEGEAQLLVAGFLAWAPLAVLAGSELAAAYTTTGQWLGANFPRMIDIGLTVGNAIVGGPTYGVRQRGPVYFNTLQLEQKWAKHGAAFGIPQIGSRAANILAFRQALIEHVYNPGNVMIQGTYRGTIPAIHYLDTKWGLVVTTDANGNFITALELGVSQMLEILKTGNWK